MKKGEPKLSPSQIQPVAGETCSTTVRVLDGADYPSTERVTVVNVSPGLSLEERPGNRFAVRWPDAADKTWNGGAMSARLKVHDHSGHELIVRVLPPVTREALNQRAHERRQRLQAEAKKRAAGRRGRRR